MRKIKLMGCSVLVCLLIAGCKEVGSDQKITALDFLEVSVHDPSIVKAEDKYYILGSHAQFAKSEDLIQWEQLSNSVSETTLFTDIQSELKSEFIYSKTDTLWAGDIQQLKNGKYYMYYCLCQGTAPLSSLGVAVADTIDGPYKKIKTILYSGVSPQFGRNYDATVDPNAIDPHVFYDNEERLWMVYGSYSGGIFILEMNGETGLPLDTNTYGKKLMGGNHSRIEAPYILYNEQTDYYYLFSSFGGLDSGGGYNMRVARSVNVDGPYTDIENQDMIMAQGKKGTVFDDLSIESYGNKLMGNFLYEEDDGLTNAGYVSAGHNSAIYDEDSESYFLVFHTRFPNAGEEHQVRVHQLFFTESGWPIVSPIRYSKEKIADYPVSSVIGTYSLLQFSKEITSEIVEPVKVKLSRLNKIEGAEQGSWFLASENSEQDSKIEINGKEYYGKFISVWDENQGKQVMSYTGVSKKGVPIFLIESEE